MDQAAKDTKTHEQSKATRLDFGQKDLFTTTQIQRTSPPSSTCLCFLRGELHVDNGTIGFANIIISDEI